MRVQFDKGWVSVTAASGKVLLEEVIAEPAALEPELPEPAMEDWVEEMAASIESEAAEPGMDLEAMAAELAEPAVGGSSGGGEDSSSSPGEVRYKAIAKGVVRKGKGKDSRKVGNLDVGSEIVALEEELVDGTTRVRFVLKQKGGKRCE